MSESEFNDSIKQKYLLEYSVRKGGRCQARLYSLC